MKPVPNQKVITIHKVHGKSGKIIDIQTNRDAQKALSLAAYELYMYFMLSMPGYTEALSMQRVTSVTALSERTYYKAVNELVEKKYLVKEYHKDFKDYYGFYENPNLHKSSVDEYIKKFLTPGLEVPDDTTLLELAKEVIDPPHEYESSIEAKIHSLSYGEFLQTLYWRAIAAFKRKQMGYKCELCGSAKKLNVHHKTYMSHGVEHDSEVIDKDLMLICEKCHEDMHDITRHND